MSLLTALLHFVEFLLVFSLALVALVVVLLIVISKMPGDNPLRTILISLAQRLGATVAVAVVDAAATPLPVGDVVIDIGSWILLAYYWLTFLRRHLPVVQHYLATLADRNNRRERRF
jgi:hypothetical protein